MSLPPGAKKQGVRTASPLARRVDRAPADVSRGLQESRRILRHAVQAHLEMQMRAGRPPGGADRRDPLPAHDEVAFLDAELRRMRVARHQAVAVVDLDHFTILGVLTREDDLAAGRGDDRRADVGREVDALVERRSGR